MDNKNTLTVDKKTDKKIVQKVQGAVERNYDLIQKSAEYMQTQEYKKIIWTDQNVMRNPRGAIAPYKMKGSYPMSSFTSQVYTVPNNDKKIMSKMSPKFLMFILKVTKIFKLDMGHDARWACCFTIL